ncbi:MAG: hypothetical protein ACYCYO_00890 [Bacilli bacterium]
MARRTADGGVTVRGLESWIMRGRWEERMFLGKNAQVRLRVFPRMFVFPKGKTGATLRGLER